MKLKLFFAAVMMSIATVVSVNAMDALPGKLAQDATEQRTMLAVSTTDTINIDVSGVTGSLTLLSYKNGENPSQDNIQYIRQYTPDAEGNVDITFKIRSILPEGGDSNNENGLYCVKLNDGAGVVKTLFYKVGVPDAITADGVEYFQKVDFTANDKYNSGAGSVSVAYKANFELNGGCVNEYGFTVMYDGDTSRAQYTSCDDLEFSGAGEFSFGVTIYGIPYGEDISKLSVVPYVNYAENNSAVMAD